VELLSLVGSLDFRLPIIHHWSTGCDRSTIEPTALVAVVASMVIFATTLHCQDFKDAEGDRMIGRKTLPILFPSLARISVMVGLPLWSVLLTYLWKIDVICSAVFVAYAGLVGLRFMMLKSTQADRKSCQLYSVSPLSPDCSSVQA
jgi:4-hydroxybenzoate polyprenyltransferase